MLKQYADHKSVISPEFGMALKDEIENSKHRTIQNEWAVDNLRAFGLPVNDPVEELVAEPKIPDLP